MKIFHPTKQVGPREFIALIALLMSIAAMSIDAMLPALGHIGTDLGATNPNQPQLVVTCIFLGMAIGQLICGPLSDAIGRKPILTYTIALYLVGTVVCLMSESMPMILFGRVLQGLGVSGPYVCSMSVVRDKFHGRQMAKVMSLVTMIFIMVPAIAPALGQGILAISSWRGIFVLYLVYAVVISLWVALRLTETLPQSSRVPFSLKNIRKGITKVFTTRTTFCYMICMGLTFGGLMGYLTSAQQIFQSHFNVGEYFALCFGGLALMFGVSSMVNARLVERLGMRPLCRRAMLANIVTSAIFVGLCLFTQPSLWMFLLYCAIIFFNFGMLFGNLNALAMEPMGHIAGLAAAIIGAFSSVLSLSMGTAIGQMYNDTLLPIAAGFLVLGALSYVVFQQADKTAN
ncbi:MAG: Bcr/CflA family drug resistance efflux transporter [Pseudomonas fluorescens]|nr:MAG: Bcr/CflA family drug resistance efflux transporter [Pseudomonas fluorescens]